MTNNTIARADVQMAMPKAAMKSPRSGMPRTITKRSKSKAPMAISRARARGVGRTMS